MGRINTASIKRNKKINKKITRLEYKVGLGGRQVFGELTDLTLQPK